MEIHNSPPLAPINPDALYPVSYIAALAGVHPLTVYQSLPGGVESKALPLPQVVRLGRLVRFRGSDILAWKAALTSTRRTPVRDADAPAPARRRGTSTKAERRQRRLEAEAAAQQAQAQGQGGAA